MDAGSGREVLSGFSKVFMKTLITGVPGTGKSTIAVALREKGLSVVDFSDVKGMSVWQDVNTGEIVEYSPADSKDWFLTKKRICNIEVLKGILSQQEDVIVTGVASGNIAEYVPLFDKVILLQLNSEDLIHRLETRDNPSGYGKTKVEQEDTVRWQEEFVPLMLAHGAIPVNSEGEIGTVVDKIIALI